MSSLDEHVLVSQLPESLRTKHREKWKPSLAEIHVLLDAIVAGPVSTADVSELSRKMITHIKLKLDFPASSRAMLINKMWQVIVNENTTLSDQSAVAQLVVTILSIHNKDVRLRGQFKEITWQKLRDLITKVHFIDIEKQELHQASAGIRSEHYRSMKTLCRGLLWYIYPESGTAMFKEILEEYVPLMLEDPHSDKVFLAQAWMDLLARPYGASNSDTQYYTGVVEQMINEWWPLVHYSIAWDNIWIAMLYRIKKYLPKVDLSPHMAFLYLKITASLDLPNNKAVIRRNLKPRILYTLASSSSSRSTKSAKLAALMLADGDDGYDYVVDDTATSLLLGSDKQRAKDVKDINNEIATLRKQNANVSAGFVYLRRLLCSVSTGFHPSNQSPFGGSEIIVFLGYLVAKVSELKALGLRVTDDVIHHFVELVLPYVEMLLTGSQSLMSNNVYIAQASLAQLAWMAPQLTFNRLSGFVYEALDRSNVSKVHLVPAAVKALDVLCLPLNLAKPLLPHLVNNGVLISSLKGIDSNDVSKTFATLKLYVSLLRWLPIVRTSPLDIGKMADSLEPNETRDKVFKYRIDNTNKSEEDRVLDEVRQDMWRAGDKLSEWASELVTTLLTLMSLERSTEDESSTNKANPAQQTKNMLDNAKCELVNQVWSLLFSRIHTSQRDTTRKTVIQWLKDNCYPAAKPMVKGLIESIVLYSPVEDTIKQLFDPMVDIVLKNSAPKSQVNWAMYCIVCCVGKLGGTSVGLEERIVQLIGQGLDSEDAEMQKLAASLLKNAISGLSETYPLAEVNETAPEVYALQWGPTKQESTARWHEPTKEELECATRLKELYLQSSVENLQLAVKDKDKKKVTQQITTVQAVGEVDMVPMLCDVLCGALESWPQETEVHENLMKTIEAIVKGQETKKAKRLIQSFEGVSQPAALVEEYEREHYTTTNRRRGEQLLCSVLSTSAIIGSVQDLVNDIVLQDKKELAITSFSPDTTQRILQNISHPWHPTRKLLSEFLLTAIKQDTTQHNTTAQILLEKLNALSGLSKEESYCVISGVLPLLHGLKKHITLDSALFKMFATLVVNVDAIQRNTSEPDRVYNDLEKFVVAVLKQHNTIQYDEEIVQILTKKQKNNISWKSQLMVSACLLAMNATDELTAQYFTQQLKSTSLPVKYTSVFGLSKCCAITPQSTKIESPVIVNEILQAVVEMKQADLTNDSKWSGVVSFCIALADYTSDSASQSASGMMAMLSQFTGNSPKAQKKVSGWPSFDVLQQPGNFSQHNTLLFETFVTHSGDSFVKAAMEEVVQQLMKSEHEYKLTVAAEFVAGVLRSSTVGPGDNLSAATIQQLTQEMIKCINGLSLAFATPFINGINMVGYEQLQLTILATENLEKHIHSSFTVTCNALRLARALWTRNNNKDINMRIANVLKQGLKSEFDFVRRESAVFTAAFIDTTQQDDKSLCTSLVDILVKSEGKQIESALHTALCLAKIGGLDEWVIVLYPVVLAAVDTKDKDTNTVARQVSTVCAKSLRFNTKEALHCTLSMMTSSSWRCRANCIENISDVVYSSGSIVLSTILSRKVIERALFDPVLDVQQSASQSLLNIITTLDAKSDSIQFCIKRFESLALFASAKDKALQQKKHSVGVFGLSAVVKAFPYSVPFPEIVIVLANVARGYDTPYGNIAKNTIDMFKRSHQDTWDKDKHLFGDALQLNRTVAGYA